MNEHALFAAHHTRIVVYSAGTLHYRSEGLWSSRTLPVPKGPGRTLIVNGERITRPGPELGRPKHIAMVGERVAFGYGHGEWGGWVGFVDPEAGHWQVQRTADSRPVIGLFRVGDNDLWVSTFLAHLDREGGQVASYSIEGFIKAIPVPVDIAAVGAWRGTDYVVSDRKGLLKRDPKSQWKPVSKNWTARRVEAAVILGDAAFILLRNEVRVIDLATGIESTPTD